MNGHEANCPTPPKSDSLEHLGFRKMAMVDWLGPVTLAKSGIKAVIAAMFGVFADKREIQAALYPERKEQRRPALAEQREGEPPVEIVPKYEGPELWVDYVADLGDGFNPTYAIAWLLSRENLALLDADGKTVETPRGKLLIMGGDQVYPTATREEYQNRLVGPYRAALPCAHGAQSPDLFVIPGNHDWYDGLTSFTRLFCQSRYIGGWRTYQRRSYFSIKLPGNWWLWGIDIQLESDIDEPQLEYFRDIADKIVTEVGAGEAKIILVTAQPSWVYSGGPSGNGSTRDELEGTQKSDRSDTPSSSAPGVSSARHRRPEGGRLQKEPEAYRSLSYFEERVIRLKGLRLVMTLSGDLHHYCHYVAREETTNTGSPGWDKTFRPLDPEKVDHRITSGGGGAYLYPTHHMHETLWLEEAVSEVGDRRVTSYDLVKRFPSRSSSASRSINCLRLPIFSPFFALLHGVLQGLLAWIAASASREPGWTPLTETLASMPIECAWSALGAYIAALARTPASALFTLGVIGALFAFCDATNKRWRWLIGILHGTSHLLVNFALFWFFARWNALRFGIDPGSQPFALTVEMVVAGGLAGSFLFGFYLFFASKLRRAVNINESFAAQRIQDDKGFLRIRVARDGLTVHAIGCEKVPRRWKFKPKGPGEAWFSPPGDQVDQALPPSAPRPAARLIEKIEIPTVHGVAQA
ncbi:MAG: hypothetical protein M3547_08850 [Acidobacteriota bacterium]|nr:hypothetical protein [Acidobacteriota bacterium]